MKQHSEDVALGGLTGQGFRNLLGRPRLDPIELLLREAVQNSWDARKRKDGGSIRFGIRIRDLERKEERRFRSVFSQEDALEPREQNSLARRLAEKNTIRVLELSDYGTLGLCGEDRPGEPTEGVTSRFGNFFFDIGRSHEESGDGGTYGFGRSSLYLAGKASLVLVDTLAVEEGGPQRRVMACRIGESFEVRRGKERGRYTGRHFWGKVGDRTIHPLRGAEAADLATEIGLPPREGAGKTGTTIMIPWPLEEVDDLPAIQKVLLRSLWPKMVPDGSRKPITFELEVDGRHVDPPDPGKDPEYSLFVKALQAARKQATDPLARQIWTLRPKHLTGHLGMAMSPSDTIPHLLTAGSPDDDQQIVERPINSIALMRPTELVVRYMRIVGAEQAERAWAGVFICNDAEQVRTAFALAEPPAHDDWIADRLSDKTKKYLVRKTLQTQLPEAVRDVLGIVPTGKVSEQGTGLSLGSAAERFSRVFLSGDGQGPSAAPRGEGPKGRLGNGPRGGPVFRLSPPQPVAVELDAGVKVARFRATISGPVGGQVRLRALPAVHAEGRLDDPPVGLDLPAVKEWVGGKSHGEECIVTLGRRSQEVEVLVVFRGDYAVTLTIEVAGEVA